MGFADYLSRNPTGKPPPPPTEEDKKFVINTINEITFALIKNSLAANGASVSKADKKQVNCAHVKKTNERTLFAVNIIEISRFVLLLIPQLSLIQI